MCEGEGSAVQREKLVEWLLSESKDTGSHISAITLSGERFLGVSITVLALGAGVAANSNAALLLPLPLLLAIVLCVGLHLVNEAFTRAGYKAAIEEQISELTGRNIAIWESVVVPRVANSGVLAATGTLIALAYVSACSLAGYVAWQGSYAPVVRVFVVGSAAVGLLAVVGSAASLRGTREKARTAARGGVPTPEPRPRPTDAVGAPGS